MSVRPFTASRDLWDNVFLVVELTGIGIEAIIVYFHLLVNC